MSVVIQKRVLHFITHRRPRHHQRLVHAIDQKGTGRFPSALLWQKRAEKVINVSTVRFAFPHNFPFFASLRSPPQRTPSLRSTLCFVVLLWFTLFTYSPRSRSITCFPVVFSVRGDATNASQRGDILLLAPGLVHLYYVHSRSIGCLIDPGFFSCRFSWHSPSPPARHPPVSFTLRFPTLLHSITDYLSLIKKV